MPSASTRPNGASHSSSASRAAWRTGALGSLSGAKMLLGPADGGPRVDSRLLSVDSRLLTGDPRLPRGDPRLLRGDARLPRAANTAPSGDARLLRAAQTAPRAAKPTSTAPPNRLRSLLATPPPYAVSVSCNNA